VQAAGRVHEQHVVESAPRLVERTARDRERRLGGIGRRDVEPELLAERSSWSMAAGR